MDSPSSVEAFNPLWVKARFQRSGGGCFSGTDLYALELFQAPNNGLYFVVNLLDDGLGFDDAANDGIFSGSLNIEVARRLLLDDGEDAYGIWRVFVFAQDVDLTKPGTPPEIAAQHIGGLFVASAISLTFDPDLPCPMKAQASIFVA